MNTTQKRLLLLPASLLGFFIGCGDGGGDSWSCQPGEYLCGCIAGVCSPGLICNNGFCLGPDSETGDGDPGDGDPGDGDPGDGDPGDGDPGDGDPGDGDPGDGDPGDGDPGCPDEVVFTPVYAAPNVMFVVDASGSMVSNSWDHDLNVQTPDVTRWFSLHGAVQSTLSQYAPAMNSGIQRFPSAAACDPNPCYNITSCTTGGTPEAGVSFNNAAAMLAAIPNANAGSSDIEGGTPTTKAMDSVVGHLSALASSVPRFIVLITDGAANCNTALPFPDYIETYDETLVPTVEDALAFDDVTTFVIGIDIVDAVFGSGVDGSPEANPFDRLNDVAVAGGAAKPGIEKFYNANDQGELETALELVLDQTTQCTVNLALLDEGPPSPMQIPSVGFEADGASVPMVDSCANGSGWMWTVEGELVTFCGSYCDDFKTGGASFEGFYGC